MSTVLDWLVTVISSTELLAALLGAMVGSASAYLFQWRLERHREKEANFGAILRAQNVLFSFLNTLQNIEDQYLKALRNSPLEEQAKNLSYINLAEDSLKLDYDSLAFLQLRNESNTFQQVHVAESAYSSALDAIKRRNEALIDLSEHSEVVHFDQDTGACTVKLRDPRLIKILNDRTGSLFGSVGHARKQCDEALRRLVAAGKAIYPKRTFLELQIAPKVPDGS